MKVSEANPDGTAAAVEPVITGDEAPDATTAGDEAPDDESAGDEAPETAGDWASSRDKGDVGGSGKVVSIGVASGAIGSSKDGPLGTGGEYGALSTVTCAMPS